MQLQENYAAIQEHEAEVIVVFREEADGVEGLQRSRDNASAEFPLVVDLGAESTGAYSTEGFQTYVIDKVGVIRAVLDGTKGDRPTADEILSQLEQLAEE